MNPTNFLALAEVRPTTHNPDPCIKKMVLVLAENLAYQWQVPELGAAVELSNRQMQRRFKAEKGCCPLPYLRRLRLEKACDTFRGVADPSDYKNYILVFLFLKYLSDVWQDKQEQYRTEYNGDEERVQRRMSRERFIMPSGCDFATIYAKRNDANIGEVINIALEQIEEVNKAH